MTIRILIADDHGVLRAGLRAILEGSPGFEVVGEAADGHSAVHLAAQLCPDIVLMDISMPGMGGVEATRCLQQSQPAVKVLILTVHEDAGLLREAMQAGAAGYIIKRAAQSDLITAIQTIARGDLYLHPDMTRMLLKNMSQPPPPMAESAPDIVEPLTPRELDVLRLIVRGNTNRQIADRLNVSVRTVEGHRANLLGKLGLRTRVELVEYAEKHGLL